MPPTDSTAGRRELGMGGDTERVDGVASARARLETMIRAENGDPLPNVCVPGTVVVAFDVGYEFDATPAPGHLWRLEFEGVTALVCVRRVDRDAEIARVVPAAEDPMMADAATVVAAPDETALGLPLGLWVSLERAVPLVVFDRPLGVHPVGGRLFEDVEAVRAALRGGPPHGLKGSRIGAPIASDLDPRVVYRRVLAEDLDALAAVAHLLRQEPPPPASLAALLHQAGLTTQALREALDLSTDEARRLFRDFLPLSQEEAAAIGHLLGCPTEEVLKAAPRPPPALRWKLHEPQRRYPAHKFAVRHGVSDAEGRWLALRALSDVAMRTSHQGRVEPDWDTLLDDFFAEPEE